jgi:hypothetical protein
MAKNGGGIWALAAIPEKRRLKKTPHTHLTTCFPFIFPFPPTALSRSTAE